MRNQQARPPQSFTTYSSSNGEWVVFFPNQAHDRGIPRVVSMYSFRNTTTVTIHDMKHQDLIKRILVFTLSVIATVFSSPGEQTLRTKPISETIVFFLIVAFSTSLAAIISSHKEGKAALIIQCVAVASTALAFASIASMFLRVRFQVIAYGLCVFTPLYAVSQTWCEGLFQKVAKAIGRWWTRTTSGRYTRGQMIIPY